MENAPPPRPQFQFHLATGLVAIASAGVFMGVNMTYRFDGMWGYGWPLLAYTPGIPNGLNRADALADAFTAVLGVAAITASFEAWLRYREGRKP
jgi:hypothetical protein